MATPFTTPERDAWEVAGTMVVVLAFGIGTVSFILWGQETVGRGLLWAAAWSSAGWFLGFLFGIPRYLSTDTARTLGVSSQELAKAIETAKVQRSNAEVAAKTMADTKETSNKKVQAALQAEADADQAAAQSATDPQNQKLKTAADDAKKIATKVRQESNQAASLAKTAEENSKNAEAAVKQADPMVEEAKRKEATASPSASAVRRASLTVNTNLEQISDWLTKIIVGVSLVESQSLLDQMRRAATFMAKSMARTDEVVAWTNSSAASVLTAEQVISLASFSSMRSVAFAIMMYFLATGLLGSYLLTRLFLQRALDKAATADVV